MSSFARNSSLAASILLCASMAVGCTAARAPGNTGANVAGINTRSVTAQNSFRSAPHIARMIERLPGVRAATVLETDDTAYVAVTLSRTPPRTGAGVTGTNVPPGNTTTTTPGGTLNRAGAPTTGTGAFVTGPGTTTMRGTGIGATTLPGTNGTTINRGAIGAGPTTGVGPTTGTTTGLGAFQAGTTPGTVGTTNGAAVGMNGTANGPYNTAAGTTTGRGVLNQGTGTVSGFGTGSAFGAGNGTGWGRNAADLGAIYPGRYDATARGEVIHHGRGVLNAPAGPNISFSGANSLGGKPGRGAYGTAAGFADGTTVGGTTTTGTAAPGVTGTTGTVGGTAYTAGTLGTTGRTGTAGTAGTAGTVGTAGTTGTVGTAGTTGTVGTAGTTGTVGTAGTTGTVGTAGTTGTTGPRSYVGTMVGSSLHDRIVSVVRTADPTIRRVYVTTDAGVVATFQNLARSLTNGRTAASLWNDFRNTITGNFPTR